MGAVPARCDFDIVAPGQLQHRQRVAHDVRQLHVAGHAAHADDLGIRRGSGIEQGQRIVDTGIAVDEQRSRCLVCPHGCSLAAGRSQCEARWSAGPV